MRRNHEMGLSARAALIALPALLSACPDQEGDPGADGGSDCGDTCEDAGPSKACGGFAGLRCGDGEFCNFEGTPLVCGRFDGLGACDTIPAVCTFENRPVCGCDGDTYPTACAAHAAGVSVEHDGACVPAAP